MPSTRVVVVRGGTLEVVSVIVTSATGGPLLAHWNTPPVRLTAGPARKFVVAKLSTTQAFCGSEPVIWPLKIFTPTFVALTA